MLYFCNANRAFYSRLGIKLTIPNRVLFSFFSQISILVLHPILRFSIRIETELQTTRSATGVRERPEFETGVLVSVGFLHLGSRKTSHICKLLSSIDEDTSTSQQPDVVFLRIKIRNRHSSVRIRTRRHLHK